MKETLRDRFSREMTVRGLSQRTQDSYLLNVDAYDKSLKSQDSEKRTGKHPTKLFTADLRNYFAWMVNVHAVESSTYRQHLAAVKLFLTQCSNAKKSSLITPVRNNAVSCRLYRAKIADRAKNKD